MTLPLLWRSGLRYHLSHPGQLGLALLGIALGVAVVLAVDLANHSARESFRVALDQVSGPATHQIRAVDGSLEEALYGQLLGQIDPAILSPLVVGHVATSDSRVLQLIGVDPLAGGVLATTEAFQVPLTDDWLAWFQGEALGLFPPELAEQRFLTLKAGGRSLRLQRLGSLAGANMAGLLVVDLSVAQVLLDQVGQLSQINVRLVGDDALEQATQIQAQLPPGVILERSASRNQTLEDLSRSFHLNLSAMSLLALLVGTFLIYNTMSFSVVQRRALLGRLRVLGVSRRELFTLLLVEALALGSLGLLLGLGLGLWLATALTTLVTGTVDDLYYTLTVNLFKVPPVAFLKAMLLGLGATTLAALLPALEAATTPPGSVLSRADLERRWRTSLPCLAAIALGLALLGSGIFALSRGLTPAFVGLFLWLLALSLLIPGVMLLVDRCLAPLQRLFPGWLRMALRDVVRHLSRTGVAVAALSVAFAATVGVALMISSFRGGVSLWLEDLLSADFYIAPASIESAEPVGRLEPETLAALAKIPGIAYIGRFADRAVLLPGRRVLVVGLTIPRQAQEGYQLLAGNPETAWSGLMAGEGILISEPLAYHQGLAVGDTLMLPTPTGERPLPVLAIFHDYASEHGRILMDLAHFQTLWPDEPLQSLGIFAAPGTDLAALGDTLGNSLSGIQPLAIRANGEILDFSLEVFERTFAITSVLRSLAVLIAFVGLLSSLLALSLERTRELAILRAIGMTPLEVARQLFAESGYQGLLAGILSLPIGILLAGILVKIINRRAFGWTLPFELDPWLLLQTVLLAMLAAFLAALYPCYRLTRVQPATDLRFE